VEKPKVLLVGYDHATAMVTGKLSPFFENAGWKVQVVAGGIARQRFAELGIRVNLAIDESVSEAALPTVARNIIRSLSPHICIVGFSSPRGPNHMETLIARFAFDAGAFVVGIEDIFGAHSRNLGSDGHALDLLIAATRRSAKEADGRVDTCVKIGIGGILPVPSQMIEVSEKISTTLDRLRREFGAVVAFGDHGERAFAEQVALLAGMHPPFGIAYTLNPKKKDRHDEWHALLRKTFGSRAVSFQDRTSGDVIAAGCDLTMVGGGSMLDAAVYSCKGALVLDTPLTIAARIKGTGSPILDVVELGIVSTVTVPCDPFQLPVPDLTTALRERPPYSPKDVFHTIISEFADHLI
jgi:hypothetical protein